MISHGRGFVVNYDDHNRFVLTASHCLPFFRPAIAYRTLRSEPTRRCSRHWVGNSPFLAECLFADPISDIALLGSRDNQEVSDRAIPKGKVNQWKKVWEKLIRRGEIYQK